MKRILLFLMLCIGMTSFAQTTWTGAGSDTYWSNTANWNNNIIPSAADNVTIPTGFTVTINIAASVKSISVQGNSTMNINTNLSFLNASSFAANVTTNWSNGILTGGGTLTNNGTVNIVTNGSRYISGGTTITNNGLFTMPAGGYLYLYDTSIFSNAASGVFDFQSDAVLSYSASTHSFNNAGLIKKTAGSGTANFQSILNNTGTISVESGTMSMNTLNKTFNGGVYNVSSGCALSLDGPANMNGTLTGVLNGAFNLNNNVSVVTAAAFNFTGSNPVNWNSGIITGGGTLTNTSKISLSTNGSRYVSGATTLTNNGTITMPLGGYLYLYDTSVLNNSSSGTFDFQSDAVLSYSGVLHSFNNAGLIKKSAGAGSTSFQAILNNTGTISVSSGTLSLNTLAKTFNGGIYNVTSGNVLSLDILTNVAGTLTGILDGAMKWTNNVSVAGLATFNFTGSSQVNWISGSLIGGGTLTNQSTIKIATNGSRVISGATTLKNTGLVTMPDSGYLYLYDTSVFNNTLSGIFDIQSDAVISYSGNVHNFTNAGLLKKTTTLGTAQIQCNLANTGTINVESGVLAMNNLPKIFNSGIYNVSTGTLMSLDGLVNVSNILTGILDGAMVWTNNVSVAGTATFNFTGLTGVNWNSGSLIGGGTLTNASKLSLTTNGSRYISGGTTLKNTGVTTMPAGGYLYLFDTSIFNNFSGGLFDIQSDAVISYSGSDAHNFINNGTLKKTVTAGDSQMQCYLTNTNKIIVESGTLTMNGLPKNFTGGEYTVNAGTQLILNTQINVANNLTGILNGAITWNNNVSVASAAAFQFSGATGVNWNSGSLFGGGTLTNAGVINITTNGSRYISGTVTTLANTGSILMPAGGYLYLSDDTTLDNKATGIIDFQSDFTVSYSGSGLFKILNAGIIKKTSGSGITSILPPTTNSGTINANSGTLNFVDGSNLVNTVNGIIKGSATIDIPAPANFTNDGTFAPGNSPGVLTVLGTYKSSASSKLSVELNGLTQGTEYDQLAVNGSNAVFNGDVDISMGFNGAIGNQFTIATTSGIATANLNSPIGNVDYNGFRYTFDVSYPGNNKVMLSIINKVDILPPTVITKNITVQLDAAGNATITPAQVNNGSSDNYSDQGNLLLSLDKTTFSCANLGANTVILTVTDEAGNFASAPATVTVVDLIAPQITCPSDSTVLSAGSYTLPDYFANSTVIASDNCSLTSQIQSPVAGTVLAEGIYTISFQVFDASGNPKACSFVLTVDDTTLSTINNEFTEKNILIYPNPVVDILTIKNNSGEKLSSLEITDASGRILSKMDLSMMDKVKTVSFEKYSSGIYYLKLNSAKGSVIKRIIKK